MAKWLVKSEPFKWSWAQQKKKGVEPWDGVRSYQALGNMREMKLGEEVMFYHSNKGLEIVGICSVAREYYDDPNDEKSGLVDLKAERDMPSPVTLKQIKADGRFDEVALVRQSRLSVMPIPDDKWDELMEISEAGAA
ncbi:EVE domain-containing protein [Pacificimonas sp. WHA3]|uniref:EVE domain-containing protein n=1 Tax=Pacificimonas pallii TaxID=2827236 RepID=A0ABS6SHG0_9SPHN|nr:EVE domain-containing protein [Pacificimonas pallii]MBV7257847.1 EVE domain-containing protein [Pacificimonas pallii]